MGNKKTRRLAGQLLKQYGLPKRFTDRKYPSTGQDRFIVEILSLKHGDLVYDKCTNMNHRVIGFLEEHERWEGPCKGHKQYSLIYHLVYEGNILGTSAFVIDPPMKDVLTCDPDKHTDLQSEYFLQRVVYYQDHCGDLMELKKQ